MLPSEPLGRNPHTPFRSEPLSHPQDLFSPGSEGDQRWKFAQRTMWYVLVVCSKELGMHGYAVPRSRVLYLIIPAANHKSEHVPQLLNPENDD